MTAIGNFIEVPTEDGKRTRREYLPMRSIIEQLESKRPQMFRVGETLCYHDPTHGLFKMDSQALFYSHLSREYGLAWDDRNPHAVKKAEFYLTYLEHVRRMGRSYEAILKFRHHPPIPGVYYDCSEVPDDDRTADDLTYLNEFVRYFSPGTPIDSDLILAATVTPAAGVLPGSRGAFMLTSSGVPNRGKTSLATAIGRLYFGLFELMDKEDYHRFSQRLLSDIARGQFVALLDNLKGNRISSVDAEKLVTQDVISGHEMYVGNSARQNLYTFFMSTNDISLGRDLATRFIQIELGPNDQDPMWKRRLFDFIDNHRQAILRDVIRFLRSEPQHPLPPDLQPHQRTRWGEWEAAVLNRLPDPREALRVIKERQREADVDRSEIDELELFIEQELRKLNYDVERSAVFIPTRLIAHWWQKCLGGRPLPTNQVSRRINAGQSTKLQALRTKSCNGFVFTSNENTSIAEGTEYDVEERLNFLKDR